MPHILLQSAKNSGTGMHHHKHLSTTETLTQWEQHFLHKFSLHGPLIHLLIFFTIGAVILRLYLSYRYKKYLNHYSPQMQVLASYLASKGADPNTARPTQEETRDSLLVLLQEIDQFKKPPKENTAEYLIKQKHGSKLACAVAAFYRANILNQQQPQLTQLSTYDINRMRESYYRYFHPPMIGPDAAKHMFNSFQSSRRHKPIPSSKLYNTSYADKYLEPDSPCDFHDDSAWFAVKNANLSGIIKCFRE